MNKSTIGWVVGTLFLSACASPNYYHAKVEQGEAFICRSIDRDPTFCAAETRGGVVLVSQDSRKACIKGRTWGERRGGIWVSEGCEGTFLSTYGNRNPSRTFGYRGNPNLPRGVTRTDGIILDRSDYSVRCESMDGRYNYCPAFVGTGAHIVNQFSDRRCEMNRTWGYDENGIWVDGGCRAEFIVMR